MTEIDAALREKIAEGLAGAEPELPPHPADDDAEVKAFARWLNGLAFGAVDQPLHFQTVTDYLAPLAQSILNRQAGWVIDEETKRWARLDEEPRTNAM